MWARRKTRMFYHVCVDEQYRKRGIGKSMAVTCMKELQKRADQQSLLDRF